MGLNEADAAAPVKKNGSFCFFAPGTRFQKDALPLIYARSPHQPRAQAVLF
jgi:hypothetical protein